MNKPLRTADWDIFCTVIDNYGDIGVCWRLARQLADEHDVAVRLWVDELAAFARICPQIDPQLAAQSVAGVDVLAWRGDFAAVVPADIVVEAFACHLPEHFVAAMARKPRAPVWINLDYLSAEPWTAGCHTLPSPHPRLPLVKYFFFPGFGAESGGLLRERDLLSRRRRYLASIGEQGEFWRAVGGKPAAGAITVSLFTYVNAALPRLLTVWQESAVPVCCLVPLTRALPELDAWAGRALQAGDVIRRGALEVRVLPFFEQRDYDRLLWSCELNLIRGEDSFVRAQWAAEPLLWQIYPQQDDAHQAKLAAFLDLYCAGLEPTKAQVVRTLHAAWNGDCQALNAALWAQWLAARPELRAHAVRWAERLAAQNDLCSNLVRFCRSKL